jgi:hypothetical protein
MPQHVGLAVTRLELDASGQVERAHVIRYQESRPRLPHLPDADSPACQTLQQLQRLEQLLAHRVVLRRLQLQRDA